MNTGLTACQGRSVLRCCYCLPLALACILLSLKQTLPDWRPGSVFLSATSRARGREMVKDQTPAPRPSSGSQPPTSSEGRPLNLPLCSELPRDLVGPINVSMNASHVLSTEHFTGVETGGRWLPRDCVARHRVAIIVPFRDRNEQLPLLLYYLIPTLKRQQLEFRMFVVEQDGNAPFNKGRLMNAGFLEAMKEGDYQCVIFHDVDLLLENDKNMYSCAANPTHLSVSIDKYNYTLSYSKLIGGVLNFPIQDFRKVNGYTNLLWCWGSEDDEMWERIHRSNLTLSRPSPAIARYKAIPHLKRRPGNLNWRKKMVKSTPQRMHKDGLNSVTYNVTSKVYDKLYTHLLVDVGQPPEKEPYITAF